MLRRNRKSSNACDPLDASIVRSSIGTLLKKSASMSHTSQVNEITSSVKKFNSVGGDLTKSRFGLVRNTCNGNKNEEFDSYKTGIDKSDDADYFYLDIESEIEIPLADVKYSPSSNSFTKGASINDQRPILKADVLPNKDDMKLMLEKELRRRCQSMSGMKSNLANDSNYDRSTSLTGNNPDREFEGGLRRVNSLSILRSSSPDNNTEPEFKGGLRRVNSLSILRSSSPDDNPEPELEGGLRGVNSQSILKSSSAYTDAPQKQLRRSTSFSTLEIREYAITLGDNPGGAQGPPISLDWEYDEDQTKLIPLEAYEDSRSPRRKRSEMHMAENLRRWRLLREKGYTLKEMNRATKAAESVRKQRMKSIEPKPAFSKLKKKIGELISSSTNEMGSYRAESVR